MNRSTYFNYIDNKLSTLSYRISNRGKLNLLDLHIYSETFFADLFNLVFNCKLKNMNAFKQNIEGIDLIDEANHLLAQVSSTCTKRKIEDSLKKEILIIYTGFRYNEGKMSPASWQGKLSALSVNNCRCQMLANRCCCSS